MSFTVKEFNPKKPILLIDGKELELSLITLHKEVIFAEEYLSVQNIYTVLDEKPELILDVIYELLINKGEFKNSPDVFKKHILSITSKEKLEVKSVKMFAALQEATSKSMPIIKNMQRYKDIQKIKGSEENSTPCYAGYFDAIAKRYGYSIEDFYQLTLRQLHILLKVIGEKTYEELEIQAALQGRKLKPRMKFDDVSPEQEKENEDQAMAALKDLQRKYQENKIKDQG